MTLLNILDTSREEIHASEATAEWIMGERYVNWVGVDNVFSDLKEKCVKMLEAHGDTAFSSGERDEAIARYTSALSLGPSNPIDILVKRSTTRASKGLWEDALTDANEVRAVSYLTVASLIIPVRR